MRALVACILLLALPAAADPAVDTEFIQENTPGCDYEADPDGPSGAGCRLARNCYSIVWGYHSAFLTVGGGSSCSGGVWVNPHEQPEGPGASLDPVCQATSGVC
jgi:hypothetical protein